MSPLVDPLRNDTLSTRPTPPAVPLQALLPSSRRARGTGWSRSFARFLGVLVALAWALSTPHAYAQPACKHDRASSTIECMPIVSSPWKYDPEGYYGDDSSTYDSYGEALDAALANIPAYWGSAFCAYDHEEYEPPWTVLARDADISKLERRTGALSGWLSLIQGGGCYYTQGQAVDVARTRVNACPAGWFQTYDGLGSLMCFREAQATPPPGCDRPCASGGPSSGGVDGMSSGWTGNPLFVHTGDKFLTELDWTSGGHRPLALSRHYLSVSFPRLVHTPHRHFGLGDYWRTSFDRRIQTFAGPGTTTKVAYRPDGSTRYFYRNGSAWQKRAEQSDALADVLDGGGAVVGWKLTLADDTREFYDLQGRVTAIVDAGGWTQTVSYDADDRVASVVDSFGRTLSFSYDDEGGLASVATPDGTIRYGLDGRTYLTSVTYPDGSQRQYRYLEPAYSDPAGPPGLLTGIVDENGMRFATYRYDGAGRGWSTEHGDGANRYTVAIGATTTVTDPLGTVRTVGRSVVNGFLRSTGLSLPCPSCGPDENVASATHDANGNVASRTDFNGKKTCYAFDLARNLETARVEGLTSAEDCATSLANPPARPDVRKTTTAWHATWRRPASMVEPAPGGMRTTTFGYDASGNVTQKKITAPKNDGTATTTTRTWKWTYGSYGRVLTATDPNSKVTRTTYHPDDDPDLGRRGQVATVTNPVGHVTQYPTEPPRICRRLHSLRGWSHEQTFEVFT